MATENAHKTSAKRAPQPDRARMLLPLLLPLGLKRGQIGAF
jgi:hypothetical protein